MAGTAIALWTCCAAVLAWGLAHLDLEPDIRPSASFCVRARPPFVCAHGGDSSRHPPNTRAAIAAAGRAGADCIEIDASATSDGQLVAMHARDLERLRLANATAASAPPSPGAPAPDGAASAADARAAAAAAARAARVSGYSLEQLLSLSWPGGDRPLPFEAALAEALRGGSPDLAIIDLKDDTVEPVPELLRAAAAAGCRRRRCLIWGKSDAAMREVARLAPGQPVGYVIMNPLSVYAPLRLPGMAAAGAWHGVADAGLAMRLRRAGQLLIAWTLDDPGDLARVLDVGVDGVVVNDVAAAVKAVAERVALCMRRRLLW